MGLFWAKKVVFKNKFLSKKRECFLILSCGWPPLRSTPVRFPFIKLKIKIKIK